MKNEKEQKQNEECSEYGSCTQVNLSLVPYWFLAALRIVLTLLPQNGYIHPDEFFQSVEVVAGDVFDIESSRPWEFNVTFPLRSIALPYALVGLPCICLKYVTPFTSLWFDINIKTSYVLLVLPRLMACLLSFATDYSMYRICYTYAQNYRARLLTLASSYVMLVYGTRTFSNAIEMALNSLLLFFVADCMSHSDQVIYQDEYLSDKYQAASTPVERVKFYKLRSSLPNHSLSRCAAIATVTVLGIFNRPTFLAFAFPPVFFWLQRGLGSKTVGLSHFHLRILMLIFSGLPAAAILIITDSFYYGYLTINEIRELQIGLDNFVITPMNFLKYNINSTNLAKHGLHPRYLHLLVNIPLLYNVVGIVGIYAFLHIIYRGAMRQWSSLPRVQSIIGLMTASFIIPVAALSVFPHQEARFLIPVTLPVIFLHSQRIRHTSTTEQHYHENGTAFKITFSRGSGRNIMLSLWYLINILFTLFYGMLHQGGIYGLGVHLGRELQTKPRLTSVHLITSHTYSLPLFWLQLRNSKRPLFNKRTGKRYRLARQFHSYEMGSAPLNELLTKIESVLSSCNQKYIEKRLDYRLYVALPGSLMEDFHLATLNSSLQHSVEKIFYPHISTEALPDPFAVISHECSSDEDEMLCQSESIYTSPLKLFSRFVQQLGLTLIRIKR